MQMTCMMQPLACAFCLHALGRVHSQQRAGCSDIHAANAVIALGTSTLDDTQALPHLCERLDRRLQVLLLVRRGNLHPALGHGDGGGGVFKLVCLSHVFSQPLPPLLPTHSLPFHSHAPPPLRASPLTPDAGLYLEHDWVAEFNYIDALPDNHEPVSSFQTQVHPTSPWFSPLPPDESVSLGHDWLATPYHKVLMTQLDCLYFQKPTSSLQTQVYAKHTMLAPSLPSPPLPLSRPFPLPSPFPLPVPLPLTPDSGFSLGHDWVAEAYDVDTTVQELCCHARCQRCISQHDLRSRKEGGLRAG